MKVSDYIINFLVDKGMDTLFMITGGQAMFLNDAVYRNKKIRSIFTHHEQAAGMAAEAYGRMSGKLGVAIVTAGPASVNVLNGVVGAWVDSSPMMVISGQSALPNVQYQEKNKIRQYGIQGINIKPLADKVTKYFITIDDPSLIKYYVQKAYHLAFHGRPGPVWLDVPLDIQRMEVPTTSLKEFVPEKEKVAPKQLPEEVRETIQLIRESKRPLLLVGHGIRISGAVSELLNVAEILHIPILTTRLGIDLIHSDHPLYVGRPGTYGERAANFAIQNADLILAIGTRLASAMVGHNPKDFGRNAQKVVIDIDRQELDKPGVQIQLKIESDAKRFLQELLKQSKTTKSQLLGKTQLTQRKEWIAQCNYWKKKYPVVLPEYKHDTPVNSYYFTNVLSKMATHKDVVLVDTGSCFHIVCQAWKIKKGQTFLTTGGISTMGYWAAGIGACAANNFKNTIVITGDGSLQFNIQEFATIKHNNLPIKVFIFNNNGYLLIRHTQKNLMEDRLIGESPQTGVWCPDSLKIARAYGIKGVGIRSVKNMERKIKEVLDYPGPVICDIITPEWQLIIPRTASEKKPDGSFITKPYEDMYPFLDKKELEENRLVPYDPTR